MKTKNNPFSINPFQLQKMLLVSLMVVVITGCSDDDEDELLGNWVERSVFDGTPRSSAVAFTINNTGYMGTGFDGDDYLKDFWKYDLEGNFWSQLADFPGVERSAAVGFTINSDGYVGTGFDGDNELNDFYQYNTSTNMWSPIANFTGGNRRGAIAFNSNAAGYVGTGFDGDNDKKDFWKYNPVTDEWTELVGFGGDKRRDAMTFSIGDKVYLGTGISNGINQEDFWEFDTTTEVWTALTDLDDNDDYSIIRNNAVGFSIGNKGYVACGNLGLGPSVSVWEYDPVTDLWVEKTEYEGISREDAIAFYNEARAFVALGRSGTLYLDDNREFFPLEALDEDD